MKIGMAGLLVLGLATGALGQARSTASRTLDLSAFLGGSGVFTGLNGGHNGSLTGGVDVSFRSFYHFRPSLEVRGTLPVDKGGGIELKDVLGGVKVERPLGRLRPYGTVFYGTGDINYKTGVLNLQGTYLYTLTSSTIVSVGGGVDYPISDHFSLKADGQYQTWDTPVTMSGHIHPGVITFGVAYRLNLGLRH